MSVVLIIAVAIVIMLWLLPTVVTAHHNKLMRNERDYFKPSKQNTRTRNRVKTKGHKHKNVKTKSKNNIS
jgi:hypothetical protein|tara:strand:- start:4173 stop:4382 length:210 start_codon:yes stop_codon:yes gene_type:complete